MKEETKKKKREWKRNKGMSKQINKRNNQGKPPNITSNGVFRNATLCSSVETCTVSIGLLTFLSLPVTIRTTRLNIQKICMLITSHLCVLCGSQKKQQLLPYTPLTDWFL